MCARFLTASACFFVPIYVGLRVCTGKNIVFPALGLTWVLLDDPRLIGY